MSQRRCSLIFVLPPAMTKPASQKKKKTLKSKQQPPAGAGKRHQPGRTEQTAVCSTSRAKRFLAVNGVATSTTGAKLIFSQFGHELLGLIAISAMHRAEQHRRRTIRASDVVDVVQRRAGLIVPMPDIARKRGKKAAAAAAAPAAA